MTLKTCIFLYQEKNDGMSLVSWFSDSGVCLARMREIKSNHKFANMLFSSQSQGRKWKVTRLKITMITQSMTSTGLFISALLSFNALGCASDENRNWRRHWCKNYMFSFSYCFLIYSCPPSNLNFYNIGRDIRKMRNSERLQKATEKKWWKSIYLKTYFKCNCNTL